MKSNLHPYNCAILCSSLQIQERGNRDAKTYTPKGKYLKIDPKSCRLWNLFLLNLNDFVPWQINLYLEDKSYISLRQVHVA